MLCISVGEITVQNQEIIDKIIELVDIKNFEIEKDNKSYIVIIGKSKNKKYLIYVNRENKLPTVWSNIQRAMNDNYTQGYLAGKKEAEDASQRNN